MASDYLIWSATVSIGGTELYTKGQKSSRFFVHHDKKG